MNPSNTRFLEAYLRGDTTLHVQLEGEAYRAYHKFWLDITNVEAQDNDFAERLNASTVFFSKGFIYFELGDPVGKRGEPGFHVAEVDPLSEDELAMIKRFADMFDFAYDRFLELREKEERAREAELQASVDRVRAEATAMAATDDIANVVKALWEGLVRQGVEFNTLVFRVEDAQTQELQMYVNPVTFGVESEVGKGAVFTVRILAAYKEEN